MNLIRIIETSNAKESTMERQNLIKRLIDRKLQSGRNAKPFCVCLAATPRARAKK